MNRIKWTAKSRRELNWPIYVLRRKGSVHRPGTLAIYMNEHFHPWAEENFDGRYMTHVISWDYESLIGIEDPRDAVRLTLWHDNSEFSLTRLVKQRRYTNGFQ